MRLHKACGGEREIGTNKAHRPRIRIMQEARSTLNFRIAGKRTIRNKNPNHDPLTEQTKKYHRSNQRDKIEECKKKPLCKMNNVKNPSEI